MPMQREYGQEHPFWPLGPFKLRLPFIHYRWEFPEMIQAFLMFVVSLGMIPLLQQYLGLPYEAALAGVVICGIGFMLPALMGSSDRRLYSFLAHIQKRGAAQPVGQDHFQFRHRGCHADWLGGWRISAAQYSMGHCQTRFQFTVQTF